MVNILTVILQAAVDVRGYYDMARLPIAGGGHRHAPANVLNKHLRAADKGRSSALGIGLESNNHTHLVMFSRASGLAGSCEDNKPEIEVLVAV